MSVWIAGFCVLLFILVCLADSKSIKKDFRKIFSKKISSFFDFTMFVVLMFIFSGAIMISLLLLIYFNII